MENNILVPTAIILHKQSKKLEVTFEDNLTFLLPFEYLRVFSPSAEVQGHTPSQRKLQIHKEMVTIEKISPVGNYAIQLYFNDGHNSGIYSWQTLYQLGKNYDKNWQQYLVELKNTGIIRKSLDDDTK